jgi:hypothetical protein
MVMSMLDLLENWWIRFIISGFFVFILYYILVRFSVKADIKTKKGVKNLNYTTPVKFLILIACSFGLFIFYASLHASESQKVIASVVGHSMLGFSIFVFYQVFFVRISYDKNFLYIYSPLKGNKKTSWDNIVDVSYSYILQCDYIEFDDLGKIYFSHLANGHEKLGCFLDQKLHELYPEDEEDE